MVLRYIGDAQWTALDADAKPTNAAVADYLTTLDTRRIFIHQGSAVWIEIGTGGGGGTATFQPYTYYVYKEGSTFYAKNGNTGAIGSSNSDATTVINYALDNLTPGRSNYETVKLRGDFTISKITIPSICVLDLREARLFQANSTNTVMIENDDTTNGNVGIEIIGGLIDGNRVNQTGGGSADGNSLLRFVKCNHVNIHDGTWVHANYHCLFIKNPTNDIRITNNRLENWKQEGVHLTAADLASGVSSGHIVSNNFFTHHRNDAVESGYSTGIGSNAMVTINVNDTVFNGNTVKNTCAGSCTTFNGLRNIISNNLIVDGAGGDAVLGTGTTSGGIVLAQGADQDYDVSFSIISNNIVKNVGKVGIHVQQAYLAKELVITGNFVDRCGEAAGISAGILVQEADNCIVTNNIVKNCYGSGIRVNGSTIHSVVNGVVSNNVVFNNGRGLSATDTHRVGIGVDAATSSTAANILVMNNRCFDNQGTKTQKYGVRLINGLNCIVRNNDVRDNLTAGCVYVTSTGTLSAGNPPFD
jgi:parallel beta-helix repeat protein